MNKGTNRRLAALAAAVLAAGPAAGAGLEDHERIRSLAEAHALETARSLAPAGARLSASAAQLDPRLRLAACPAAAARLEATGRIRSLAAAHALAPGRSLAPAGARLSASAAQLDPRLRLAACPVVPETFSAPGSGLSAVASVGVRCPAAPGWSLYVPVEVEVLVDVVVLAAPAATGQTLTATDLRLEPANVARLGGGYLTRIDDAEGRVLKRPVRPGTVLTAALLARPTLVRRGQRVELLAGGTALAVRTEGE